MKFQLGILGVGNMGEAMLKGILEKHAMDAENIAIFDQSEARTNNMKDTYRVTGRLSAKELIEQADVILLAVKPNVCAAVVKENAKALKNKAILSIVTGWKIQDYTALVPDCRVLPIMPNTPCMVGAGMSVFSQNHTLTAEEYAFAKTLFEAVGLVDESSEALMPAITGVSGSGPAYVYMFIEALADGGVAEGLPRAQAYQLAAQTVLGAAKMVLDTGTHPGALKDAVCSPGGTTILAVSALEHAGFRAAVLDAVSVCTNKARELQKKQ
ncbi:pyrroline-5-carboxylate reductase [Christensenellaceae bacterium OttesenSCG-928-L17]|nr:pyrroline-5-carboxylate reductase [Christensenellaceae bacterium OttesenSCG-928-L17]